MSWRLFFQNLIRLIIKSILSLAVRVEIRPQNFSNRRFKILATAFSVLFASDGIDIKDVFFTRVNTFCAKLFVFFFLVLELKTEIVCNAAKITRNLPSLKLEL